MALQLELARRLKKFRIQKGLTQRQASEQSGIPLGTYIKAETDCSMGDSVMRRVLNWMNEAANKRDRFQE